MSGANGSAALVAQAPTPMLADVMVEDPVAAAVRNVETIDEIIRSVMKEGRDFGVIPGCPKASLYQPGAEKICQAFGLRTKFDLVERRDMDGGHREYTFECILTTPAGTLLTNAFGLCLTLESRYRWRSGIACLECGQPIRESKKKRGEWYCWKKTGGCGWKGAKPAGASEERRENPDIADEYHTVLAIARKRALVLAVKTGTAASDRFTEQDEPRQRPPQDEPPPEFCAEVQPTERRRVEFVPTAEVKRVGEKAKAAGLDGRAWLTSNGVDWKRMSREDFNRFSGWAESTAATPDDLSPLEDAMVRLDAAGINAADVFEELQEKLGIPAGEISDEDADRIVAAVDERIEEKAS